MGSTKIEIIFDSKPKASEGPKLLVSTVVLPNKEFEKHQVVTVAYLSDLSADTTA